MNTPTEQTPVDLEGLIEASFYRVLDNEEIREGDLSPAVLACGPCLYPVSGYGGIAEKHEDFLRPFDINPILSEITTAQQRIAELEREVERERKLEEIAAATAAHGLLTITSQSAEIESLREANRTLKTSNLHKSEEVGEKNQEIDRLRKALRGADEALASTYWTSDDGENIRDSEPDESGASPYVIERWKALRTLTPPPQGEEVRKSDLWSECLQCHDVHKNQLRPRTSSGTSCPKCGDSSYVKALPAAHSTSEAEGRVVE